MSEPSLLPGAQFGKYRISRLLGEGAMGAVYEAEHGELRKRVAIKILGESLRKHHEAATRFVREGEVAARVRHPHVVDIADVGVEQGLPYLVMEFLDGEDLQARVQRGALGVEEAIDALLPILSAVQAAHDEGIIHRDIKPANIYLARTRHGALQPKLLDFGISKVAQAVGGSDLTRTSSLLGSPFWMAPEQVHGAKYIDARSDQYALGVVLYQCLTGSLPFVRDDLYPLLHAILNDPLTPPRTLRAEIEPALEAVVLRAMARDAQLRLPSVLAFGQALLPFASVTVRAVWAPAFAGQAGAAAATPSAPTPPSLVGAVTGPGVASAVRTQPGLPSRGMLRAFAIALVAVVGLAAAAALALRAKGGPREAASAASAASIATKPVASTFAIQVVTDPASAQITLDGQVVGTGALARTLEADGRDHVLRVSADGFLTRELLFHDAPPPSKVTLEKGAAPVETQRPKEPEPVAPKVLDRARVASAGPSVVATSVPAAGAAPTAVAAPPPPPPTAAPPPTTAPPPVLGNNGITKVR
jgi:serine/threonine-protein kinase